MLSKAVCKRCHEEHNDKWTFMDDLDWDGTYSLLKDMKVKTPCIRCYAALNDVKVPRKIPINKGIPTDCSFHLEHIMVQTC